MRCQKIFDNEMEHFSRQLNKIKDDFLKNANKKLMRTLKPSLAIGARKAHSTAMSTVNSWGSKLRGTKNELSMERNGFYWSIYLATARRNGLYASTSAGSIDLNAELVEPMEAEFTPAWQSIMDEAIRNLISESESRVIDLCKQSDQAIVNRFCSIGINKVRLASMVSTSASNCMNTIRMSFSAMRDAAVANQRALSRSLLPKIQRSMHASYEATISVSSGSGIFNRMKDAMQSKSREVMDNVFSECMNELLIGIQQMLSDLSSKIEQVKEVVSKSLASVYSILWEDHNLGKVFDPDFQRKLLACRTARLPLLNQLRKEQDEVMKRLHIERPVSALGIAAVESWEEKNAKQILLAKANGAFVELLDDTEDNNMETSHNAKTGSVKKVTNVDCEISDSIKTEAVSPKCYGLGPIPNETISLLDSSDDDSNYDDDDYIDFNIRSVVARAGKLGLEFEKVEKGFMVREIRKESQFIGKIFLGDILKSIDGKRLSKLEVDQFMKQLEESSGKRKRRIYVLRAKVAVTAQAGGLGLVIEKVPKGFVIRDIKEDSQLLGKVFKDDILISINGIQLSKLDDVSRELKEGFNNSQRRICILRKQKERLEKNASVVIPKGRV